MCLLAILNKMMTPKQATKAMLANSDGIGIAYRDKGKLYIDRDISIQDLMRYGELYQGPYMVHFRLISAGANIPQLMHPFPIQDNLDMLAGSTNVALAHNGHIMQWENTAKRFGIKVDKTWSDTKMLAYMVNYLDDHAWLDDLASGQKFALMNKDEIIRYGSGWYQEQHTKNIYSNIYWDRATAKVCQSLDPPKQIAKTYTTIDRCQICHRLGAWCDCRPKVLTTINEYSSLDINTCTLCKRDGYMYCYCEQIDQDMDDLNINENDDHYRSLIAHYKQLEDKQNV